MKVDSLTSIAPFFVDEDEDEDDDDDDDNDEDDEDEDDDDDDDDDEDDLVDFLDDEYDEDEEVAVATSTCSMTSSVAFASTIFLSFSSVVSIS